MILAMASFVTSGAAVRWPTKRRARQLRTSTASGSRMVSESTATGGAARAAIALWFSLAVLAMLRALFAFVPSMWAWGFDALRFVAPIPGWTLWALSAVTLIPAVGRLFWRGLEATGRALESRPGLAFALSGIGGAALVWAFPDVVHFVGDFLIRDRSDDRPGAYAALFPQALPLDILLHLRLPRMLSEWLFLDAAVTARALGSLEAGLLAMLGVGWGRALGLRGAVALAAGAVVFFGGHLGALTGYPKAAAELALLTVAMGVFGLRVLRDDRSSWLLLGLGTCAAAGFVLHRAALAWLPALAFVAWHAARAPAWRLHWRRPLVRVGAVLLIALLAAMLPRIVRTVFYLDPVHLTPPDVQRLGVLRAMFAGTRLADLFNLIALLSPVALGVAVAAAGSRWRPPTERGREALFLAFLAVPWIGLVLIVHPVQGLFRDWDNFVATGVALSLASAWWAASVLTRAPAWAWLSVPLALGAVAPTTQWLLHSADLERGLGRVETFLREPPERSREERARHLEFIGLRANQLRRWDQSAEAMERAAELTPRARVLMLWATAENARGNTRQAQDILRRMVTIAPEDARGWEGLANVSWNLGDWAETRRALVGLQRLAPGDPMSQRMLERLERGDTTRAEPSR